MKKAVGTAEGARLAALLREVRHEAALTQEDLADRLGVDPTVITKIEANQRRVDLIELDQMCEALGVSLISFVWRFLSTEP